MNKKIKIPESWEDITIGQYQYYTKSIEHARTDKEKAVVAITAFCDLNELEVEYLTNASYNDIVQRLKWVEEEPREHYELIQIFEVEGNQYGFIPNWAKLTFGEYVDLEMHCTKGDLWQNLDRALAIMYRPVIEHIKGHYKIEDYTIDEDRVALMREMPMTLAVGAMVFFWNTAETFAIDMPSYSQVWNSPRANGSSGINGDGTE